MAFNFQRKLISHTMYLFKRCFLLFLFLQLTLGLSPIQAQDHRVKTIVTTDGEIDDVDTFIRMLLYANEFKLEGLVYSSSMWHYRGDGKGTKFISKMPMTKEMYGEKTDLRWPGTNWIQELIQEYAKVYPNLIQHSVFYPSPEELMSLVRVGNIDFEGGMDKRTAGSEFIKEKLMSKDSEALFLQAWGGTNTIARALKSIEEDFTHTENWEAVNHFISSKAIIYTIMDQDDTYMNYISKKWPDIKVFYNAFQFGAFAYPWQRLVPKNQQKYFEGRFMGSQIINNHGPLLKKYYSYGDGQKQVGDPEHIHGDLNRIKNTQWGSFDQYAFISEGDTPAYLHLVDIGLDNFDHPSYGGWGGRFVQSAEVPSRYEDGELASDLNPETGKKDNYYPQTRWISAIQNDFAARADWCIFPFEAANHPPQVNVEEPTAILAKPGATVKLHFSSSDIDGDSIQHKVWNYTDLSTAKAEVKFDTTSAEITIGKTAAPNTEVHLIVEGTDTGTPPLTRYRRVVVKISE